MNPIAERKLFSRSPYVGNQPSVSSGVWLLSAPSVVTVLICWPREGETFLHPDMNSLTYSSDKL